MKAGKTVDEYILNAKQGKDILIVLREILKSTNLIETVKWGGPVYTYEDKNIVGIGSFKSYVGLWFFQGALLNDEAKVLINAQKDITKALRQWRFSTVDEVNEELIVKYIQESIENFKQGKEMKPNRNKPVIIPDELKTVLSENSELKACFYSFTPGCQREFANFITQAKRSETRENRIKKIIPMILQNIGMNDKYRK